MDRVEKMGGWNSKPGTGEYLIDQIHHLAK